MRGGESFFFTGNVLVFLLNTGGLRGSLSGSSLGRGVRGTVQSFKSAVRILRMVSLLFSCRVADDADGSDSSVIGVFVEVRGVDNRDGLP